jgi:5-methylcytosine-specific restriction endonuclease McrA
MGRVPTRQEYLAILADTVGEDIDELPPETSRALSRLESERLGRKDLRLTRKKHMPRGPRPKAAAVVPRAKAALPASRVVWLAVRQQGFQRSGYCCERCGVPRQHAFGGVLHGHHRLLRSRGGPDELANCAILCAVCHEWVHKHDEAATELGYIVASGSEPAGRLMLLADGRVTLLDDTIEYELIA